MTGPPTTGLTPIRISSDTLAVEVIAYGASLVGVWHRGSPNLILRMPELSSCLDRDRNPHLGAVVGRYANRIAGARFTLDGVEHRLVANQGPDTLHGGPLGFSRRTWSVIDVGPTLVRLELVSGHGDQGFPGRLVAQVDYSILGDDLVITTTAVTDAATVVSLANHAYWNLAGGGTIDEHVLQVDADALVEVDGALIPTGRISTVEGTEFDFRRPSALPDADHCLVGLGGLRAELSHPPTGRSMAVTTDLPGLQVYAGLHLGDPFEVRGAVCLEAQQLPDAPNQPTFPSAVVRPGETDRHVTTHRFALAD